jgi:5-deoxy-glucuronate isomerase
MEEKKVFGYPQVDANGDKVLCTYDNAYRDMLQDIRVYRMKKGETRTVCKDGEETAMLLLNGSVDFEWEGSKAHATRKNVFDEGPWALHVCRGIRATVTADADSELIFQSTHNERQFASRLYKPEDAPWGYSCVGMFGDTAKRRVNTLFDYQTAPYSNMVLGEVLNDRGNWSGYLPHQHPQPECYYFMFDRPEGFGASFVGDQCFKIKDGSFSAIPGGNTHPQSCAPGFQMYTCWMIRHLDGDPWTDRIDDPRYTWLYDAKF